jgi:hypothetical protein
VKSEMTEEQQFLQLINDAVELLIKSQKIPMRFFLVLHLPSGLVSYFGNGCAACMVENINEWAESNNIQHNTDAEETVQ